MKTKLHFIGLFLCSVTFSFGQATWTTLPNFPDTGREAATSFTIGSVVYYTTGHDGTSPRDDTYAFDVTTNTWTQKAPFVGPSRYFATSFVVNGYGYVGTGKTNTHRFNEYPNPVKTFYKYDPINNSWSGITDMPGSPSGGDYGYYGCVGLSNGGKGYVIAGGTALPGNSLYPEIGSSSKTFYQYDPTANAWSSKNYDISDGLICASGFTLKGKAYLMGGFTPGKELNDPGTGGYNTTSTFVYDFSTNTWTKKSNSPGAVYSASIIVSLDRAYIIGGFQPATYWTWSSAYSRAIYKYNPYKDSWTTLSTYSPDYMALNASSSNCDRGYITTGYYYSSGRSQGNYRFDPVIDPDYVNGSGTICSTFDSNISLQLSTQGTVSWASSPNISITGGQGTKSISVRAIAGSSGSGWVQPTLNTGCAIFTFPAYTVWVGPPLAQTVEFSNPDPNGLVCSGNIYGFRSSPSWPEFNYNWSADGGNVVGGQGTSMAQIYFSSDNYLSVFVTASNTCGSGSGGLGLSNDCGPGGGCIICGFAASPNPTSSSLTITLTKGKKHQLDEVEITVFNDSQIIEFSKITTEQSITVPSSNLRKGLHFLHIRTFKEHFQEHIIIN